LNQAPNVVFRSAKEGFFRGAKDHTPLTNVVSDLRLVFARLILSRRLTRAFSGLVRSPSRKTCVVASRARLFHLLALGRDGATW
jgi:hypothetical protein